MLQETWERLLPRLRSSELIRPFDTEDRGAKECPCNHEMKPVPATLCVWKDHQLSVSDRLRYSPRLELCAEGSHNW